MSTNVSALITPSTALQKKNPSFLSSELVVDATTAFIFSKNDHQSYSLLATIFQFNSLPSSSLP
ncbi:MAG: hypothetical protein UHE91_04340 [Bacteroidales bacterium]|nr:hypothetical protein [Bacteroidales bacterium]